MNLKHRVRNFWDYFLTIQMELEEALKKQERSDIAHYLEDINSRLANVTKTKMEIEMNDGFFEMTFPCGSDKTAQLCSALLKKDAPELLIENWIINAYRPALSELAMQTFMTIEGKEYHGSDFKVYYTINTELKMLDIKVYCEGLKRLDQDTKERLVAHMLELFIGELEFEARIASVSILDEVSTEEDEDICLLPNFYEDICDLIMDQEWMEYYDPLAIYTAYKLDEKPMSETLRNDMKLIVTTNSQLQEEILNKEFETCKEFYALGGQYGYVYYEKMYEDEKEALLRQQLEKEMNELLYPLSIARTMGGAVGVHYSYVDVAVFDIDGFQIALEKMNEKMNFKMYYRSFLE